MSKLVTLRVFLLAAAVLVLPASAHHAGAVFDAEKTLTLKGDVKDFQWTNPHSP